MTREEAVKRLKEAKYTAQPFYYINEAIDYAVAALEQEPKIELLDKIKAEVKGLTYYWYWCEVPPKSVVNDVIEILDKYKQEN